MWSHRLSQLMNSLVILLTGSPPFLLSKNFCNDFIRCGILPNLVGLGVPEFFRLLRFLPHQSPTANSGGTPRTAYANEVISLHNFGSLWKGGAFSRRSIIRFTSVLMALQPVQRIYISVHFGREYLDSPHLPLLWVCSFRKYLSAVPRDFGGANNKYTINSKSLTYSHE